VSVRVNMYTLCDIIILLGCHAA